MNTNTEQTSQRRRQSSRTWIILLIVLIALLFVWGISRYNSFVKKDEQVNNSWSQVENQYQRRLDLIPNLVSTVKGYATHERETLEGVINARASASQVRIDPENMTQEQLNHFQAQQDQLSSALSRLMLVVERYPELKADKNFLELQAQLEGTENRIATSRRDFNVATESYNIAVRHFPSNVIASICGFHKRPYFQAIEGSDKAPKVEF